MVLSLSCFPGFLQSWGCHSNLAYTFTNGLLASLLSETFHPANNAKLSPAALHDIFMSLKPAPVEDSATFLSLAAILRCGLGPLWTLCAG